MMLAADASKIICRYKSLHVGRAQFVGKNSETNQTTGPDTILSTAPTGPNTFAQKEKFFVLFGSFGLLTA